MNRGDSVRALQDFLEHVLMYNLAVTKKESEAVRPRWNQLVMLEEMEQVLSKVTSQVEMEFGLMLKEIEDLEQTNADLRRELAQSKLDAAQQALRLLPEKF